MTRMPKQVLIVNGLNGLRRPDRVPQEEAQFSECPGTINTNAHISLWGKKSSIHELELLPALPFSRI